MKHLMGLNAASSFDRQLHLSDLIGEHSWHVNLKDSVITFEDKFRWRIQLLGTESETTSTWLWAWANDASKISVPLLVASLALKAYGELHNIPELTTPELPLNKIDGHTLALLASSLCEAKAYYRCPYEGGALFVLIMDESFPKCQDPPLQRVATVFPQAIASLEIPDHKLALTGYLDSYKLGYEQDGGQIVVNENGESVLKASFDEHNRLSNLEVRLKPRIDNPNRSNPVDSWYEGQLRRMLGG